MFIAAMNGELLFKSVSPISRPGIGSLFRQITSVSVDNGIFMAILENSMPKITSWLFWHTVSFFNASDLMRLISLPVSIVNVHVDFGDAST